MKNFIAWIDEHKVPVIVSYAAFMVLFYFLGLPKQSFGAFIVSFLGVTLFFIAALFVVKTIWFDQK